MKAFITITGFICVVFAAGYFEWWRCGEMFPHAQFACFIGSGR